MNQRPQSLPVFWTGLLATLLLAAAARARSVDLLYVEPNVGTASGGHVAVRFGDDVYHFQNAAGDWLLMDRVDADFFRYTYSVLENRGIHIAQIPVDDAAFATLRTRFNEHFLVERVHFDRLEAHRRDRALLAAMAAGENAAPAPFVLRGAGFFAEGPRDGSPPLARVRERIRRERGIDHLARRSDALAREIRDLTPKPAEPDTDALHRDRYPRARVHFSQRFEDLTLQRLALAAIERAAPLRPEATRRVEGEDGIVSPAERRALEEFQARLEDRLTALVGSSRPDWGFPVLLASARLLAVDETLRSGRWVVLEAFPDDAVALPGASVRTRRAFLGELEDEARRQLVARRAAPAPLTERRYNALEDLANRLVEVERGLEEERSIRVHGARLVPQGRFEVAGLVLPGSDPTPYAAPARWAEERYEEGLGELYRYDLLRRNCVTELLRIVDAEVDEYASAALLGGRVDPDGLLHFIPVVAFEAALRSYPGADRTEIPSYRHTRVEEMIRSEGRAAVFLRESNTLTSTVYRRNPEDSFFLFFTDDAVWPRPVFGAFNVVAGVGESVWGLLQLPFDGGRRLLSGARGVAFSLPELVFLNFRKGTLEYGPGPSPRTSARE